MDETSQRAGGGMGAELAIIIVNYRTAQLTLDCLATLEGEITSGVRVVVVDNASDDGSAEAIERAIAERGFAAWATVLRSPRNGGFAAGNNVGLRAVAAEAYILLNSDTLVCPRAIAGLRAAMRERPDAGVIGPGLLDARGRFDQSFFRDPAPPSELLRAAQTGIVSRLLRPYDPLLARTEHPMEVDWLGFACVLIRREVIEQVGLLDEGYFMYFEDIDYCRRVRAAGWRVLYWPEPKIVHLLGGSSKVTDRSAARRRAPRYYYEARARFYAKFYGRRGLWIANAFWHLGRGIALSREVLGEREPRHREREALDIWTNAIDPLREPTARSANA